MLRNYLKIAYRNLVRHKGYAFINVFGLAVGLAACLLIGLYVQHERSYDRFHTRADRIYRLVMEAGNFGAGARAFAAAGPYFTEQFPEIQAAVRFHPEETVLQQGEELSTESRFYYTDAEVFGVFSYTLLAGNPTSALEAPGSLVLTESSARRYFGKKNPVGQTLTQGDGTPFQVTGVVEDPPSNTHLPFDFLASFETLPQTDSQGYQSQHPSFIYLLLHPEADLDRLQERLDAFTAQDVETVAGILGVGFEGMRFRLQPLTDIHLYSHLRGEAEANSDVRLSILFSAVALFLLLIAVINYMNLATARALSRAREVGVRKVVGAGQGQLAVQFLGEAMLLCLLAFALALGLAQLLLPLFNLVTGKTLSAAALIRPEQWGWLTLVALGTGFVVGSYPAFYLSRFRPVGVLKGDVRAGRGAQRIRQTLVTVQFALSILLVIGTLVVWQQVQYLQSKDLGYDTEQILAIPMQGDLQQQTAAFKAELQQVPDVRVVSVASGLPLESGMISTMTHKGEEVLTRYMDVDADYLPAMGMRLVAGRNFRPVGDSAAILLNETAARQFGVADQVGRMLDTPFSGKELIGIVSDFHVASLHEPIMPTQLAQQDWSSAFESGHFVLRLSSGDLSATLERLASVWRAFVPDVPFTYHFLDDVWQAQYQAERRLGYLTAGFALLAILIACLGLFGLVAFTAEQRTKEIGIRKVLGASVTSIVALLSKDFLWLVAVAFVVAAPVAYLAMRRWLEGFAYRVEIGPGVFLLAGGLALLVALVTVSYQAVKAALADPVESLRYE